ncbi:hypothetical protein AMTRI_Chr10g229420 [Amborella trichopoda]
MLVTGDDKASSQNRSGTHNSKVKGNINHHLPSLISNEHSPRFLQLYFYDTETEVGNRLKNYNILNPILIDLLTHILQKYNPYFFKDNEQKLRNECYQGLHDNIVDGEVKANKVGKRVILPASFIEGNLNPGDVAYNRRDFTTRVFRAKLEDLKKYVIKGNLFWKVIAHICIIAHMLLIMATNDKIQTVQQIVSVEQYEQPHIMDNNVINNTWVVLYNSKLLLRYRCHTNVEVCINIKAVTTIIDEVQEFQQARWVVEDYDLPSYNPDINNSDCDHQFVQEDTILNIHDPNFCLISQLNNCNTFLYRALLAIARSNNILAWYIASTGIVAINLPDGRTTHSMFKIPLTPTQNSMCNITKQSKLANIIKNSIIIIWDEAPMMTKYPFETVDRTFQDIMFIKLIFNEVFLNGISKSNLAGCEILATRNDNVVELNNAVISIFLGEEHAYCSFDNVLEDIHNLYPEEFLNPLILSGFPPHMQRLKVSAPLLRNLNPKGSLYNGTKLLYSTNPINFKRKQLSIRHAFAITVNKAQRQTIPLDGIFLEDYVFALSQLYVALSRGTTKENTKVYIEEYLLHGQNGKFTKNILYK